ncbi:hypothetical protein [Amycolatopsis sp.]|uniref:hypothetical protein n=1 Tax=Amycolatopsis sp. TaxID=37632 RepID=UPI002C7BF8B7|nr:hypothetical protein [Amycolatopsis sp.]HVV08473.1 hypothetical protein [Amycolatopsis sp.]
MTDRRTRIRLDALRRVLHVLAERLAGTPILVQGSASLALRDERFPRTPQDLDLAVASPDAFELFDFSAGGITLRAAGRVPFQPGREVRPVASALAIVGDEDRFLVEVTADERRVRCGGEGAVRWQPVEYALADRYQSYLRIRKRLNMRWQDLADSVHLLRHAGIPLRANEVRRARDEVLSWDRASAMYSEPPEPPSEWLAAWRKTRLVDFPELCEPAEARRLFRDFWQLPDKDARWRGNRWENLSP